MILIKFKQKGQDLQFLTTPKEIADSGNVPDELIEKVEITTIEDEMEFIENCILDRCDGPVKKHNAIYRAIKIAELRQFSPDCIADVLDTLLNDWQDLDSNEF